MQLYSLTFPFTNWLQKICVAPLVVFTFSVAGMAVTDKLSLREKVRRWRFYPETAGVDAMIIAYRILPLRT
jgi:hypothetical protein